MRLIFVTLLLSIFAIKLKVCFAKNLELLILHNNDMHARFEETSRRSGVCKEAHKKTNSCVGGFARVAHVIREARKSADEGRGPKVLYLNAGDTYTGTPWFSVHKWKIVAEFLNLLQPDAMSFGNHEFDNKVAGLVPFLEAATFPIISANTNFSKEPSLGSSNVTKSVTLDISGRTVGIIGYVTPQSAFISAPENITFEDEVASIKEESERLDKQGVNIIIAVGHSGYKMDMQIAKEVPLVDLVVGGHTNTFLWNGPKPDLEEPQGPYPTIIQQRTGKKVPVVQAYAYTKYMGHLNILFNEDGDAIEYHGQPLLLNASIPEDQDVLGVLEKYRSEVEQLDKEIVGQCRVLLDGRAESCRKKECNFGNLIADAYVAYHSSLYSGSFWTDAPIALLNGGSVRTSIEPKSTMNKVTRGELLGAMPFEDEIISMSLNGSDLLATLEIGVRGNGDTSGGELLQVSGVRYRFDKSKPVGSRIIEARVRCGLCGIPSFRPIELNRTYRIITTAFLNEGGDGHTLLRDRGYDKVSEDLIDIDMVVWYMKKFSPVYPQEEDRMIVEEKLSSPEKDVGAMRISSILLITLGPLTLRLFR